MDRLPALEPTARAPGRAARGARAALTRPGAARRWLVVLAVVGGLCTLPVLVAAVPAAAPAEPAARLLARALASAGVGHEGYAESTGRLPLPTTAGFEDAAALLGETSRLRVWWAGPEQYRVDLLTLAGERDSYTADGLTLRWDSGRRRVDQVVGAPALRLPEPADLLPDALARRLLGLARPTDLRAGPTARVAGRVTRRLVVVPGEPGSLVGRVECDVDTRTGLPLAVRVIARGGGAPVLSSHYLDVALRQPAPARTRFSVPVDAAVRVIDAGAESRDLQRLSALATPAEVDGLPRRADLGGAGTYGSGYALVAVVGVPDDVADRVARRLAGVGAPQLRGPWHEGRTVSTALVSAAVVGIGDRGYLLSGTVPVERLARIATELARTPPVLR